MRKRIWNPSLDKSQILLKCWLNTNKTIVSLKSVLHVKQNEYVLPVKVLHGIARHYAL